MRRNKIYAADWNNGFGGSAYEFGTHTKTEYPLRFIGIKRTEAETLIAELKETLNVESITFHHADEITYMTITDKKTNE